MNIRLLSAITGIVLGIHISAHAQLVISGVIDAPLSGGTPKAVELYASSNIADLSQWGLGSATNGGGSDGVETIFTGSATAGDYFYIATESTNFTSFFGFAPTFIDGTATNINGNDAIELFFDPSGTFSGAETVFDTFGNINVDGSGQSWDYMDGWAYRLNGTGPDGSIFNDSNWLFSGINALDGELTNATSTTPMPSRTYAVPEPSTYALIMGLTAFAPLIWRRRKVKSSPSRYLP